MALQMLQELEGEPLRDHQWRRIRAHAKRICNVDLSLHGNWRIREIEPDHPLKDLAGQMCLPAWGLLSHCSDLRIRSEETLLELQKELLLSHSNLVAMIQARFDNR
jgi:hypothetical protein